jgi:hypothetical protein
MAAVLSAIARASSMRRSDACFASGVEMEAAIERIFSASGLLL